MAERTISENLQRLKDSKSAIGNAIIAKGGTVSVDDGLEEFAADIATIPSGGGGGSSIENCFVGSTTLPEAQFNTLAIETGFAPKIVGAWVYDEVNNLNTFSVVYGVTTGNQNGIYFQDGGYTRAYTANGTSGIDRGHIIGTFSTGFTIQTCEPYFAGREIKLVAIG